MKISNFEKQLLYMSFMTEFCDEPYSIDKEHYSLVFKWYLLLRQMCKEEGLESLLEKLDLQPEPYLNTQTDVMMNYEIPDVSSSLFLITISSSNLKYMCEFSISVQKNLKARGFDHKGCSFNKVEDSIPFMKDLLLDISKQFF